MDPEFRVCKRAFQVPLNLRQRGSPADGLNVVPVMMVFYNHVRIVPANLGNRAQVAVRNPVPSVFDGAQVPFLLSVFPLQEEVVIRFFLVGIGSRETEREG